MKYKQLGQTGLLVSELSFGTWVTFSKTRDKDSAETKLDKAFTVMKAAYEGGVNYFECAEGYGEGEAEEVTGRALKKGFEEKLWTRADLVISTKLYFGALKPRGHPGHNPFQKRVNRIGLGRKHIFEGMKASLERLNLDYVDIAFAHCYDPITSMEEVVRGFNFLIEQGYCFYWGTSEWSARQIQEAIGVAEKFGLIGPVVEQPQYSLLVRDKVEVEYRQLYPKMGLTTWSPLAYGILTGKYRDGIPANSRLAQAHYKNTREGEGMIEGVEGAEKLRPIAESLGCSLAQLALAWSMSNPNVSSTIGGATTIKQVKENLDAVNFIDKLTPQLLREIDEIFEKPELSGGDQMGINVRARENNLRNVDI